MAYGDGVITPKGYRRVHRDGRYVMEHVWLWEQAYGPIPPGHDVHHVDGDKLHNELSNFRLVTTLEHKRIHSGCELRDGEWWKPCPACGEMKPVTAEHWYFTREGYPAYGKCRPCRIREVVRAKQARRAAARAARGR